MGDNLIKPPTTRQERGDERDRDQGGEGGVVAPVRPMSATSTSLRADDTAITALLPNVRRSKRTRSRITLHSVSVSKVAKSARKKGRRVDVADAAGGLSQAQSRTFPSESGLPVESSDTHSTVTKPLRRSARIHNRTIGVGRLAPGSMIRHSLNQAKASLPLAVAEEKEQLRQPQEQQEQQPQGRLSKASSQRGRRPRPVNNSLPYVLPQRWNKRLRQRAS